MRVEIDYTIDAVVKKPTPKPGQVFVYSGDTYIAVEIPQYLRPEFTPIASTKLFAVRLDNGKLFRFDSDYNCGTIIEGAVLTRPQTDEDD